MAHYIFNNLAVKILFRAGYIIAHPLAWTQVSEFDVVTGAFNDALSKGQIQLVNSETHPDEIPAISANTAPVVDIQPDSTPTVEDVVVSEEPTPSTEPVTSTEPLVLAPAPDETTDSVETEIPSDSETPVESKTRKTKKATS